MGLTAPFNATPLPTSAQPSNALNAHLPALLVIQLLPVSAAFFQTSTSMLAVSLRALVYQKRAITHSTLLMPQ